MTTRVMIGVPATLATLTAVMSHLEERFPDAKLGKNGPGENGVIIEIPDDTVGIYEDDWEGALSHEEMRRLADDILEEAGQADRLHGAALIAYKHAGALIALCEANVNVRNPACIAASDTGQATLALLTSGR